MDWITVASKKQYLGVNMTKFYDINKLNPEQRIYMIMFDNFERKLYRQGIITMEEFNQIMKEKEEHTKKI